MSTRKTYLHAAHAATPLLASSHPCTQSAGQRIGEGEEQGRREPALGGAAGRVGGVGWSDAKRRTPTGRINRTKGRGSGRREFP